MSAGRVLFLAPSAYTLSGLATWLDYLLPGLEGRGWQVTLGLVSGPGHHRPEAYLAAHPSDRWLPVHTDTCTPEGRRRAVVRAIDAVRSDVVVSVNIPDAYAAVASLRARGRPLPRVVMTLHGIQGDLTADAKRYRDTLDAVVATNRLAMALAAEASGLGERTLYVPYGVATVERPAAAGPVAAGRPFRVVFSGRLERDQKRVQDLPAVCDGLAAAGLDWRLRVAGGGPEEGWLRARFEEAGHRDRVEFLGVVPPAQMSARVYSQADALLLTSSWETGPLVIWEAMAHGVSVVSSTYLGSGREGALKDGDNCLLFPVGDAKGAAEALARLAREPGLAARLTTAAGGLIRERYSVATSVAAWDDALQRILMMPRREPPGAMPAMPPQGRLDRMLGPHLAETLRALVRRRFQHGDAGGEWPHSHSPLAPEDEAAFWALAARLESERA